MEKLNRNDAKHVMYNLIKSLADEQITKWEPLTVDKYARPLFNQLKNLAEINNSESYSAELDLMTLEEFTLVFRNEIIFVQKLGMSDADKYKDVEICDDDDTNLEVWARFNPEKENTDYVKEGSLKFYVKTKYETGSGRILLDIPGKSSVTFRDAPLFYDKNKKTYEPIYTTPINGDKEKLYIPKTFPPNNNWHITNFEKSGQSEYGPFKIRTDAHQLVPVWVLDPTSGIFREWEERDSGVATVDDGGYLIHGGGYTNDTIYKPLGNNKYIDTTRGCIRISNDNVNLIVTMLGDYLKLKGFIRLEVK